MQENKFENVVWNKRPFCLGLNELMGPPSTSFRHIIIYAGCDINERWVAKIATCGPFY